MSKKFTLEEENLKDIEKLLRDHVLASNVYDLKKDIFKLINLVQKRDLRLFKKAYQEYAVGMYIKNHGAGALGFSSKEIKISPKEHEKLIADGSWQGFLRWWLEPAMGKEWKSLK